MSGPVPPPYDGPPGWTPPNPPPPATPWPAQPPPPVPWQGPPQPPGPGWQAPPGYPPSPYGYPARRPGMSDGARAAVIVGAILGTLGLVAVIVFAVLPLVLGAIFFSNFDDDMFGAYGPQEITVGEAFSWNDSFYATGWKIAQEDEGRLRPTGLTFSSTGDAVDSPAETYAIAFVRDGLVVTKASCETGDAIEPGSPNTLRCGPSLDPVGAYDEVVIGYPEDLSVGEPWDTD